MSSARSWVRVAAVAGVLALTVGCSSSKSPAGPSDAVGGTTTLVPLSFDPSTVGATTVGPITGGGGRALVGPPGFDLASVGYQESEYSVSGTASSYTSDAALSSDGQWNVRTDASAPYTTRIVVRRPIDPAKFNGTVYMEWLNVTGGLDASPDWSFAHVSMIRDGAIWVGVSSQVVGIDGNGGVGSVLALKVAEPVRYASLSHPGDDYSYDMFSQAGATVRTQSATVLGGLMPARVIATGESQSASRLTTYVDAVAPSARVFDAYLLHSRGASAAALNLGTRTGGFGADQPAPNVAAPDPTLVRPDVGVPVMVLSSEVDLIGSSGLGYATARQPDTNAFRGWEMAGTSHNDAYMLGIADSDDGSGIGDTALLAAMSAPPSSVYFGVIKCDVPINAGPHAYVERSALTSLDTWARTSEPPPEMPRLELDADGTGLVVDSQGIALGGIRTPQVDVPIARLSGLGQPKTPRSFCGLFGTTVPFDPAALAAAYPDHATFVDRWDASVASALANRVILPADADQLKKVAMASTIGG